MTFPRAVATGCAVALVVASAGFGSVYAYQVGIKHSIPLAVLSVLMALALEGVKPLAIANSIQAFASVQIVRGASLALLGLVAVVFSLTSELSLVAISKGDLAAERLGQSVKSQDAARRKERLESELSALGSVREPMDLEAQLSALLTDKRLSNCDGWLESLKLRTICIEQVAPLRSELARSNRKEAIDGELRELRTNETGSPVGSADPASQALATYLAALGFTVEQNAVAQWLVLIPVLALEVGSALALVLVRSFGGEPTASTHAMSRAPKKVRSSGPTTDLVLSHLRASGGLLVQSERALAEAIGVDRSTTRRAVRELASLGLLRIEEASRKGTKLRLM